MDPIDRWTMDFSTSPTLDFAPGALAQLRASLGTRPAEEQLAILRAHQHLRWRAGIPMQAESYLEQFPALLSNSALAADLILSEIDLRLRSGDTLNTQEYLHRFPNFARDIRFLCALDIPAQERVLASRLAASEPEEIVLAQLRDGLSPNVFSNSPQGGANQAQTTKYHSCFENIPRIPWYRIIEVIGRGGTGVVYLAQDRERRQQVAIKTLRNTECNHPVCRGQMKIPEERLRWGAHVAARLQHPNVIRVLGIGECSSGPYQVMEFVQGKSLESHLTTEPWAPCHAAQLIETLAQATHFIHREGFVHRDIKPGNVLLRMPESNGAEKREEVLNAVPLLTDFDLAWDLEAKDSSRTPIFAGTPAYMAPEQIAGDVEEIGHAVDVYSLGAILYRLLTGEVVPTGAKPVDVLGGLRATRLLPSSWRMPRIDTDLETICLTCLMPEPTDRYQSALELGQALGYYLEGPQS
ncbi:MAG: serine/threonine-protein kinase [Gemmataceae bacterium]